MSKNINSERVTFLLYLDDPIQSEIIDYIVDLSPSRKGEVLREIISMGWEKFNKDKLSKKRINIKNTDNKKGKIANKKIDSYNNIEENREYTSNKVKNNLDTKDYYKEDNPIETNTNNKVSYEEDKDKNEDNENKIDKINPLSSFKKQFGV